MGAYEEMSACRKAALATGEEVAACRAECEVAEDAFCEMCRRAPERMLLNHGLPKGQEREHGIRVRLACDIAKLKRKAAEEIVAAYQDEAREALDQWEG